MVMKSNKPILVTRSSMPPFDEYTEMIHNMWENRWLTNMGNMHRVWQKNLKQIISCFFQTAIWRWNLRCSH